MDPIVDTTTVAVTADSATASDDSTLSTPVKTPDSGTGSGSINTDDDDAGGTPGTAGAEPTPAEKRIHQLVGQRKEEERLRQEAERLAEYYRGIAEGRSKTPDQQTPTPVKPDTPPEAPTLEQFADYDDYDNARQKHLIDMAKWELRREMKQESAAQEQARLLSEAARNWNAKLAKGAETYPDFQRVISNPAFAQSETVAFMIKDSDIGPDLAYYLGTHLAEVAKLNALPNHVVAKEIGKLEAKLSAPKPPEIKNIISQAPEPIKTVGARGAPDVDDSKLSTEEWIAKRNAQEEARLRGGS